ncbi:hypothetical protein [Tibeticola sp.]|uniref:hypothetical protein n=1 Tax=Tibeticola sp. TaxID=2005368 RepID=UPI0025D47158|nr:hypothetical protein [Tibeticola sp.]
MDTTNISLLALLVSFMALPVSYYVATQQVKLGLDQQERRTKRRTRLLVAERLDELNSLFYTATKEFAKIDLRSGINDLATFEKHMPEIDSRVQQTGILVRLSRSIDEYVSTGEPDVQLEGDVGKRLQIIRGLISQGSTAPGIYATYRILDVSNGGELSNCLRAIKSA